MAGWGVVGLIRFPFSKVFAETWPPEARSVNHGLMRLENSCSVSQPRRVIDSAVQKPIAFFAHERGDARVMKRIAAFQAAGREVIGFTFHRVREKADVAPTWENIHLGTTYNRRYLQRLGVFASCVGILWKQRKRLATCSAIYVVNTDNALLALSGRLFSGKQVPLILELADIQPAMLGGGVVSKILRAIERAVLKRCSLLVTTSPGFVKNYFIPIQAYTGDVFLLENKVYPSQNLPSVAADAQGRVSGGQPWVIGCFGALRCRRSLQMMHALALKMPERVRFVLRGYPAGTLADDFKELLGNLPNFEFLGAYQYPQDLAAMYAGIDFNWAFDETDPNGNSAWLLPNRIYEGGCFGVPALAGRTTETGAWITTNQLGWTFDEPLEESLAKFFETLTLEEWSLVKSRCVSHPREAFTGEADYVALVKRF